MVQGEPRAQLLASDHALGNVPYLPLGLVIGESLHHHELYPEMGCTPVLVVLLPEDIAATRAVAAALKARSLPQQQVPGEGDGVRYLMEVPWNTTELHALSLLLAPSDCAEGWSDVAANLAQKPASAGWPLHFFGPDQESALHLLARCNWVEGLDRLLAISGDDDECVERDVRDRTALHAACGAGATEAASLLLARGGWDVNAADVDGATALSLASRAGSVPCVRMLLEEHHAQTAALARNASALVAPLEAAASAGHCDVMKLLLAHGAAVDEQNPKTGRTALHVAVRSGMLDAVKLLVESGASLRVKDRSDRLPHEHLPDDLRKEGAWLVDASKALRTAKSIAAIATSGDKAALVD